MAHPLWYAPLTLFGTALVMLRLFAAARFLPTAEFGTLSAGLLVASTFSVLGALGLYPLLQRDLPVLHRGGRGAIGSVRIHQAILVAIGLCAVSVAAALVGVAAVGLSRTALVAALFNGLAQQCFLIVTLRSRSSAAFLRYGWETLLRALAMTLSSLSVGLWTGSAAWMLWTEALVTLVACLLAWHAGGARAHRAAPLRRLLRTSVAGLGGVRWRAALTLMAGGTAAFGLANADRWVGALTLSAPDFGIYAFGAILVSIAQTLQATINAALLPWLARLHLSDPARALRVAAGTSVGLMMTLLLAGMALIPAMAWLVHTFFDRYIAVLPLLPWFVATAAARLSEFWSTWLVVTRRESTALWVQLSALPTLGAALYAFAKPAHGAMVNCALVGATFALVPWCIGAVVSLSTFSHRTRPA
ncbi:MAG TPA: hypothetical protein VNU71_06735 [Burkholderiaceae bacterium]|nr:hypothetical protein [Burkholderiaceae bacterium]